MDICQKGPFRGTFRPKFGKVRMINFLSHMSTKRVRALCHLAAKKRKQRLTSSWSANFVKKIKVLDIVKAEPHNDSNIDILAAMSGMIGSNNLANEPTNGQQTTQNVNHNEYFFCTIKI